MDLNKILENFIAKYFEKKLLPGIRETACRLNRQYGGGQSAAQAAGSGGQAAGGTGQASGPLACGKDYYVNCFGFQTSFMMRYMLMAFGAVCLLLLAVAAVVNREALEGVKIFGTFFILCFILWLVSKRQSGFIVYGLKWIYIDRPGKKQEFSFETLKEIKVVKKLTLVFESAECVIPLEGVQYMDFMAFMEKNYPKAVKAVPKDVYDKAMRKHAASWGNRM